MFAPQRRPEGRHTEPQGTAPHKNCCGVVEFLTHQYLVGHIWPIKKRGKVVKIYENISYIPKNGGVDKQNMGISSGKNVVSIGKDGFVGSQGIR